MSKPTNDWDIYNFYNPDNLFDMLATKGLGDGLDFRYIKDYINTKISMFKYKKLPKGITSRILEMALCMKSYLCFYKNSIYPEGILCQYRVTGEFNEYWQPTNVDLVTFNNKPIGTVKFEDVVQVRDNTLGILPIITITQYIEKISYIEKTLMKNVKQARIPAVFTGSKEQVATFNKMIQKAETDNAFAIGDKQTVDAMSQYDMKFPVEPESWIEIMKNYMNWCQQSMGIYSGSSQKRERMLTGEVQSQNDYVDMIYQDELDCRKEFIKQCNEKFGWKIELVESYREYTEEHIKLSQAYAVAQIQNQGNYNVDKGGDNNE